MYKYLMIFMFSLLTACTSTSSGALYSESNAAQGNTGMYVYRPHHVLSGSGLELSVDGNQAANLKDTGFVFVRLNPGTHELSIPDSNSGSVFGHHTINHSLSVRPREVKYVKIIWSVGWDIKPGVAVGNSTLVPGSIVKGNWIYVEVPKSVAINEMKMLRQS